jgi:hypothetical protein
LQHDATPAHSGEYVLVQGNNQEDGLDVEDQLHDFLVTELNSDGYFS